MHQEEILFKWHLNVLAVSDFKSKKASHRYKLDGKKLDSQVSMSFLSVHVYVCVLVCICRGDILLTI